MAKRNVKSFCLGLILTFFLFIPSLMADTASQVFDKSPLDHSWRKGELRQTPTKSETASEWGTYATTTTTTMNPRVFQEIDALNYTIDIQFNPGADPYADHAYITATSSIRAKAKASTLTQIVIDFYDNITITSLKLNGVEFSLYTRSDNKIWMNLISNPILPEDQFEVTIDYTCVIGNEYQGVLFRNHPFEDPNGAQIYYSMNQPYMSPGWYPCFDYPGDKVTVDMHITCPAWMVVVANGLPQPGYPVDHGDGTKTHYWKENYQIYTSVIAVNMTNYVTWSDTYISPLNSNTQMPLTYYVFPEDEANARATFGINKDAMVFYAQKFGEYPFINEKYGIAEVSNPAGSMEHQTITALTYRSTRSAINWDVQVHELAHQWWGDWVTCDTWHHVWLDEGMATYAEILFHEYYTGEPAGTFISASYDDGLYAGRLAGTVYAENLADPWDDQGAIYDKAGWVIHMLRHMLGDTQFFAAVKAYGQAHAYSTAVTDDMRTVMETYYGHSLVDYFNQWIYTPYRPVYSINYVKSGSSGNYTIDINLNQTQGHQILDVSGTPVRDFYIMPVDFTVHYTDMTTETFTFQNNSRNQSFQINTVKEPNYIVFDENINILKVKSETPPPPTIEWSSMTSSTTNELRGVWGSSGSDVFAVGAGGTIRHYNGSSWSEELTSTTINPLHDVWGSSGSDVFAVGDYSTILHYNGSSWSEELTSTSAYLGIWGSSGSDVFIVGSGGAIRHYNGSTWSSMSSGTTNSLNAVWGSLGSDVFAVGAGGTILHYAGSTWSAMTSGTTLNLDGVWGSSGSDVFVVGAGGTILHYNGSTWSAMSSGTTNSLNAVWGSSGSDVFAAGAGGAIRHYDGSTWSSMISGTMSNLFDVWGSSGSDVFAVGAGGIILHYAGTVPPTLIQLSSFTAARGFGKIILEWTTESEFDNAGFNILRAEAEDGEYVKINDALIPAKGSLTQGAIYEFTDRAVRLWKSYWYKLEDIDLNGKSTMHGPIKVSPRLLDRIRK